MGSTWIWLGWTLLVAAALVSLRGAVWMLRQTRGGRRPRHGAPTS